MMTFEDLEKVDGNRLAEALKSIDMETLVRACAGTSPSNKEFIRGVVDTERFDALVKEFPPTRIEDIDKAQNEILEFIRKGTL
ncbi:MAG: hypothetical protein J5537_10815 [Lachnospiraceae bacterium]|nr:hypothetical protein [Lachnospiraceae bacterium]